jgi:hypothetical protein
MEVSAEVVARERDDRSSARRRPLVTEVVEPRSTSGERQTGAR